MSISVYSSTSSSVRTQYSYSAETTDSDTQLSESSSESSEQLVTERREESRVLSDANAKAQALADALDSVAMNARLQAGGMSAPAGRAEDPGFTKAELGHLAEQVSVRDAKRSSDMAYIAANFDDADADQDGKVTASEAGAFRENQLNAAASSDSAKDDAASGASDAQDDVALADA
jgi:hypothetical protein